MEVLFSRKHLSRINKNKKKIIQEKYWLEEKYIQPKVYVKKGDN